MPRDNLIQQRLKKLLSSQNLAVLSTVRADGQPYASLVAFVASEDLQHMYFATSRFTRKYTNLQRDSRVALLVNDSSNVPADFYQAVSATGTGEAAELSGAGGLAEEAHLLYVARHPHLESFVESPTCSLFQVTMKSYYFVENFQNVTEVHLSE